MKLSLRKILSVAIAWTTLLGQPSFAFVRPAGPLNFPAPVTPSPLIRLDRFVSFTLPVQTLEHHAIEQACLKWVQQNTAELGGLRPEDFAPLYTRRAEGKGGMSDFIYVNMTQIKGDTPIYKRGLKMAIQVVDGTARVVHVGGDLDPRLTANPQQVQIQSDKALQLAYQKLQQIDPGLPPLTPLAAPSKTVVRYVGGTWRTVSEYLFENSSYVVAVDLNTGETFGWDGAHYFSSESAETAGATVSGEAKGRVTTLDYEKRKLIIAEAVMQDLDVKVRGKREGVTDAEGKFTLNVAPPVPVEVGLVGPLGYVRDTEGASINVADTAQEGQTLKLMFNAAGQQENPTAQATAMHNYPLVFRLLRALGVPEEALPKNMRINTNLRRTCNAHFVNNSINFYSSSGECNNSSQRDVVAHEAGHGVDDVNGGIEDGGLSEGYGDILANALTNISELGLGFFKDMSKIIRNSLNKYKLNPNDEVHRQGQALAGFYWDLKTLLEKKLGAALGKSSTDLLVIPAIMAGPSSIPGYVAQVVLRARDKDGNIPHWEELKTAASNHGIAISRVMEEVAEGVVEQLSDPAGVARVAQELTVRLMMEDVPSALSLEQAVEATQNPSPVPVGTHRSKEPLVHPQMVQQMVEGGLKQNNIITDIRDLYKNVATATLGVKEFKSGDGVGYYLLPSSRSGVLQLVALGKKGRVLLISYSESYIQAIGMNARGTIVENSIRRKKP
ncbi:MAG: hypothetical protein HY399_04265 [Elusimicrobia bacterium]|nr:hypothetical protein [Elusimicrobiota bacterium]